MQTQLDDKNAAFYIVAHEPGAEHPSLPTWANNQANPAQLLTQTDNQVEKVMVAQVPGAFQLHNVLSAQECQRLIAISESLGYNPDAAVSLPRSIRHNDSLTWVVDEATDSIIWQRCVPHLQQGNEIFDQLAPVGINPRFRFYRYGAGDFFKPHTDGSWPGSRVINNELVANAYPDRWSQMTFLILLSEDFVGGETQFWVNKQDPSRPAKRGEEAQLVNVRTPAGSVLCFPHGMHPMHCVHGSLPIEQGTKYIIRTDMLFPL